MKPTDLDDTDPPAADGPRLTDAYARGRAVRQHRARVRTARYATAVVAVVAVFAGGLAWVRHDDTPRRVVASPTDTTTTNTTTPSDATTASIVGFWQPESVTGYQGPLTDPPLSSTPTLEFRDATTWGASDGCNGLSGSYRLDEHGAFHAGDSIISTLVGCQLVVPLSEVMKSTARLELAGGKLVLLDAKAGVLATFARPASGALIGEWRLTSIPGRVAPITSPPLPRAPFLRFISSSLWEGTDGCNGVSGSYSSAPDGGFRIVGTPVSTKVLCANVVPTVAILGETIRTEINGDQLALFDAQSKQLATYQRARMARWPILGNWRPVAITGYSGPLTSPPLPVAPLLHFDNAPRGRPNWTGSDGCNDVSGVYAVSPDGTFTTVGSAVQTQKACIPAPALVPTGTVVTSTKRLEISDDGSTVTMFDGGGNVVATYARAA